MWSKEEEGGQKRRKKRERENKGRKGERRGVKEVVSNMLHFNIKLLSPMPNAHLQGQHIWDKPLSDDYSLPPPSFHFKNNINNDNCFTLM